ncbi:hypothetical protein [Nocardia macrotermitis]|uniref:Uncharacterized protein n=1 Tax=Nocardia macrotermitis TaxID=2585198 RepID=A0A7K0DEX5_9NOCA|nr:hypothetical protein [Nocardia macrotermitis]MQY24345.1 hypothetical protein [Nocardia macrotermitis]
MESSTGENEGAVVVAVELPDKGQKNAQAAFDAAKAGTFVIPVDSAKRLAASCDKLVLELESILVDAAILTRVTGFPELPSGRALAKGFSGKGQECMDTLASFQEAGLRYKAAYLAAGKQFTEADQANQAAIRRATLYLDQGHHS